MADDAAGERSEDATPRKRQRERERGRVARSQDLTASLVLLGAVVLLRLGGHTVLDGMRKAAVRMMDVELPTRLPPEGAEVLPMAYLWMLLLLYCILPFVIAMFLIAYLANVVQVGFLWAPETLQLNPNKINPVEGFKRLFSLKSLMKLVMNIGKLAIIVAIAYVTLSTAIPNTSAIAGLHPPQIFAEGAYETYNLAIRLAITLFVLGVADAGYQFYQHNVDMRMTKQEVKEEMKDLDGDPQIKARRRQIHRQMAMERMMQEVPEAEVVVRNPTHFAVALKFDPQMEAPVVVAKGRNKIAEKILELARRHGVPTWHQPPLARGLFRACEVGDPIPPEFFAAVAEVLAHVLRGEKLARHREALGAAT